MSTSRGRWERFFSSKRKASGSALLPALSPSTSEPCSPLTPPESQFPSPSFIRPKTSRMTARNESYVKNSRPSEHLDVPEKSLTKGMERPFTPLVRPNSFDDNGAGPFFSDLNHFPEPPKDHFEQLPLPDTLSLESILDRFLSDNSTVSTGSRTSDASLAADQTSETAKLGTLDVDHLVDLINRRSSSQSSHPEETQQRSHVAGAAPHCGIAQSLSAAGAAQQSILNEIEKRRPHPNPVPATGLASGQLTPWEDGSVASEKDNFCNHLAEPALEDFMALTDDDIAESIVTAAVQEALPSATHLTASFESASPAQPHCQSYLTSSPPYASRPAAAAAYESARIALEYEFDLVYVINLWSDTTRPRSSSSRPSTARSSSSTAHHLTGRLLAAYGLENVASPFQISAPVHAKILRQTSWIEYRSREAENNVFSRGYACSFSTGQMSSSHLTKSDASTPATGQPSVEKCDRGLVFAAYRKPRPDGTVRFSDQNELKSVKTSAQGLVEMLMDNYVAHRLHQAPIFTNQRESGPLAAHHLQSA